MVDFACRLVEQSNDYFVCILICITLKPKHHKYVWWEKMMFVVQSLRWKVKGGIIVGDAVCGIQILLLLEGIYKDASQLLQVAFILNVIGLL